MGKLSTLIIVTMLMVSVSGFFKGKKSHSEATEHYEWSELPKYETIHLEHEHEYENHYEQSKKEKKWSWLPSWPWKKNKEHSHESHHHTKHYPIFKIHKIHKGVKVHPVKVIHHTSAPVHQVPQIIYHSSPEPIIHEQHITHPVYHHATIPHEVYQQEVPSPVYHHEVHSETSPAYHHQEEIHEQGGQNWKLPEIGSSQWAQLETHHSGLEQSNEEAANEIISSFLGEGHSIDTLEKLMPTLQKDKNLFNKLKQLHHLKSWLPTLKKSEENHHQHNGHEDKKSKHLFNFLPKMFNKHSVKHVPQVIETHEHHHHHTLEHTAPQVFPTVQHLENYHVPTVPLIPVAIPIHQTITATVIEHPKKVYEIEHQNKKEVHNYEHHNAHQIHNSYGEQVHDDSYSGASEHNEVLVPPPTSHNLEQKYTEAADGEANQEENSITLKST